jgi:NADPH-dependent curcumin reductase CurA
VQIATQIALAHPKCKVTAIAGSDDKIAALRKLGCHNVLNYKDKSFKAKLKDVGLVDLYFDNGELDLKRRSILCERRLRLTAPSSRRRNA